MASLQQQEGGAETTRTPRGHIPEELQRQAKKAESPVVSEILVSARKGYTAEVERLLQQKGGGSAGVVDKHGRTCLHLVCVYGHFDTALAILQTGLLDINVVNKRGLTPLHEVCVEGHTRIALLLLSFGAVLSARTKEGWTPLMFACSNGHTQLAQLLVALGSDINTHTKTGLTCLHIAGWKGHAGVVEMLLKAGCNPLARTNTGKTALAIAQEEERHECATMLQAATSKQSEDPVYRISTLEGQVRLCQEKLVQAHQHREDVLADERAKCEEKLSALRQSHDLQMEQARQRIFELEVKLTEVESALEKALKSQPEVKVDGAVPTNLPSRRRKAKSKAKETPRNEEVTRSVFSPTRAVSPDTLQRSASTDNVREGERGRREEVNRSLDMSSPVHPSHERLTITDLVASHLNKPGSMAVIRKELKADGLTPRIMKKFPPKTTPASLPAVHGGGANETSPLTKTSKKPSSQTSDSGKP